MLYVRKHTMSKGGVQFEFKDIRDIFAKECYNDKALVVGDLPLIYYIRNHVSEKEIIILSIKSLE